MLRLKFLIAINRGLSASFLLVVHMPNLCEKFVDHGDAVIIIVEFTPFAPSK